MAVGCLLLVTFWTDNPCQNFLRICTCIEGPPSLSDQEIDDIIELWKNQEGFQFNVITCIFNVFIESSKVKFG